MKSHNTNLDIFRHSDANLARLNREAAERARTELQWTDRERERRVAYYEREAKQHEARMR